MEITNINNTATLNISNNSQADNTSKLSSGFKINRDSDTAATLSIRSKKADSAENVEENTASAMSTVSDIDKADEMVERARQNILANPDQSVLAQANQESGGVVNLVQ